MARAGSLPDFTSAGAVAAREPVPDGRELRELFLGLVPARFSRLTGAPIGWALVRGRENGVVEALEHPLCTRCPARNVCPRNWAREVPTLIAWPVTQRGRCASRNWCSIVPVAEDGRCLAACKIVDRPTAATEEFDRRFELLGVLVENFVLSLRAGGPPAAGLPAGDGIAKDAGHPLVRRAVAHIEDHFHEADLSVGRVAAALESNASYLGHVFAAQTGLRMHVYIAQRRIEQAGRLLTTTNWQVKRVAYVTGHHSADWFSHVFRRHTGLTPGEFRRRAHRLSSHQPPCGFT